MRFAVLVLTFACSAQGADPVATCPAGYTDASVAAACLDNSTFSSSVCDQDGSTSYTVKLSFLLLSRLFFGLQSTNGRSGIPWGLYTHTRAHSHTHTYTHTQLRHFCRANLMVRAYGVRWMCTHNKFYLYFFNRSAHQEDSPASLPLSEGGFTRG